MKTTKTRSPKTTAPKTTTPATPFAPAFAQRIAIVTTAEGKTLPRYKFNADPSKSGEEAKALAQKYYDFIAKKLAEGCKVVGYLYHSANPEENDGKKWAEDTRYEFAVVDGKLTATPIVKADKTAKTAEPKKSKKTKTTAPKASAPKASATTKADKTAKKCAKPTAKADKTVKTEPTTETVKSLTVEERLDIMEKNITALTEAVRLLANTISK